MLTLAFALGCVAHHGGQAIGSIGFRFEEKRGPLDFLTHPSRRALRNAMSQGQPSWQSFVVPGLVEPAWLNGDVLDEDAWRLEIFYANLGFFDARFLGWEVIPKGHRKDFQKVRVVGRVSEGEPSRVRRVRFEGLDELRPQLRKKVVGTFKDANADIAEGSIFDGEAWRDGLATIEKLLGERSYAHARVEGDAAVYPSEHAVDLTITVTTGPRCTFGPVTITGLKKVKRDVIEDQVAFDEGEPFNTNALARTRARLYALRVFGVVDVVPDRSDPTASVVPVTVTVTEARPRELRAGPLFQIEPGKALLAAHAQWRDDNVINRLWRMEQETELGVGTLLPDVSPSSLGKEQVTITPVPIVDVHGKVEIPHLLGPSWSLLNEGQVQLGLETGYQYFSTSFSPSLAWHGVEDFVFSGGYRIQYTDYFNRTINLRDIEDSPLGLDLKDPYLLSVLEQRLLYDGRDDPLAATRGSYWAFALGEAGGPFGGDFQFFRVVGEGRLYLSVPELRTWDPGLTFAGRLGWGVIVPYGTGPEASVPYAERLYLGGANSVRGWGPDRLGPYVCDDGAEGFGVSRDATTCTRELDKQFPAGGNLSLMGSLEVRKTLPLGFSFALFSDVGQVWDTVEDFNPRQIQVSLGGGLRYGTLIGPIRADLAWRAYSPPYFHDPNYFIAHDQVTAYLALGEAF